MTKLLLIRHGKAMFQDENRFWGSTDIELSETGVKQVERLADRLAHEKIDALYCSALKRARATADIVASRHKLTARVHEDLRECNFGFVEGLTFEEISKKYPDLARDLREGKSVTFPGGESLDHLYSRVRYFVKSLGNQKQDSTIGIVGHGGPLRIMVCALLGLDLGHWLQFRIDHASLTIVETYQQGAMLNLLNDISHLADSG